MLLVHTKAGPSPIHRLGLIAQTLIPKGTKVWEFMPGFDLKVPEADLAKLSPNGQAQLIYYAYLELETREFVLSGDDDRFTNHSDNPNTAFLDDSRNSTVATCDIQPGEEITIDYNTLVVVNFPEGNTHGVKWETPKSD